MLNEVEWLSEIEHQNIVSLLGHGVHRETRFLVYEMMHNESLESQCMDELRYVVLLVFANKQDLPNAMNAAEITNKFGLHSFRQRHW
ncbi:hypothetical protein U1Q18_018058 [Sarracenia purpurea var. burkii]